MAEVYAQQNLIQVLCIKGQIGHLLHFFMPAIFLVGLLGPMGGTFVLTSLSLIFGGVCMLLRGAGGIPPSSGGHYSPWFSNVSNVKDV